MRVADEESCSQDIKRGVRQGGVLSPEQFNLYSEIIMRDLMDLDGIRFGGRNINNIRYADDTDRLNSRHGRKTSSLGPLSGMCNGERGLKLNVAKTKVMVIKGR